MELAQRLVAGSLTLGEAFAFMSGLYFRGKLAYARHFGEHVLVIRRRADCNSLRRPFRRGSCVVRES